MLPKSILKNNPDMHLIILLIDERPEEVTDIKEADSGSNVELFILHLMNFQSIIKEYLKWSLERAKRLVEHKQDVVILLDIITRLARAYNLTVDTKRKNTVRWS